MSSEEEISDRDNCIIRLGHHSQGGGGVAEKNEMKSGVMLHH
jgi:hypothetical protein